MLGSKTQTSFDLEYFFDITPDLLCIAGFDGYFKKINPAVSKTLGYSTKELFASPINSFVHPNDQHITSQKRSALGQGESLLNFENRYIAKDGSIVWFSWTSVPIQRDKLIFAIAKNITYRKQLEEFDRISSILGIINDDHQKRFKEQAGTALDPKSTAKDSSVGKMSIEEHSQADHFWLGSFEAIVRKHTSSANFNLSVISDGLAISQRHLFRRVNSILGITPNELVRVIRLQMAWEAIASGRYRSIKEISNIAGYNSRSHFSRLFFEVYGISVSELL